MFFHLVKTSGFLLLSLKENVFCFIGLMSNLLRTGFFFDRSSVSMCIRFKKHPFLFFVLDILMLIASFIKKTTWM